MTYSADSGGPDGTRLSRAIHRWLRYRPGSTSSRSRCRLLRLSHFLSYTTRCERTSLATSITRRSKVDTSELCLSRRDTSPMYPGGPRPREAGTSRRAYPHRAPVVPVRVGVLSSRAGPARRHGHTEAPNVSEADRHLRRRRPPRDSEVGARPDPVRRFRIERLATHAVQRHRASASGHRDRWLRWLARGICQRSRTTAGPWTFLPARRRSRTGRNPDLRRTAHGLESGRSVLGCRGLSAG